jgi:hypothetical protein
MRAIEKRGAEENEGQLGVKRRRKDDRRRARKETSEFTVRTRSKTYYEK